MRVAIYHRVKEDVFDQKASVKLMMRNAVSSVRREYPDAEIVGYYVDEGTGREAFQQMMKDAEAGKFDRIETESVRKFVDDARELLTLGTRLKKLARPVRIHFEFEGITTGTDEWEHSINFLMSVLESAYRNSGRKGARCRI